MPKKDQQQYYITVNDQRVNLFIHTEMRRNSRVSIGRKGVTIRLPKLLPSHMKEQQVQAFTQWAIDRIREKPTLLPPSSTRKYVDGYTFALRERLYILVFSEKQDMQGVSAKLINGAIHIAVGTEFPPQQLQKAVPALVSRLIAKQYHSFVYNRLLELNELYFGKKIVTFKLKYTHSVWGSCSRKGNINISTRLLFAPDDVIDYVLIHELAHLVHPNHSADFWNEVERVMPNYMDAEKWLKKNGGMCDF